MSEQDALDTEDRTALQRARDSARAELGGIKHTRKVIEEYLQGVDD